MSLKSALKTFNDLFTGGASVTRIQGFEKGYEAAQDELLCAETAELKAQCAAVMEKAHNAIEGVRSIVEFYLRREIEAPGNHQEFAREAEEKLGKFQSACSALIPADWSAALAEHDLKTEEAHILKGMHILRDVIRGVIPYFEDNAVTMSIARYVTEKVAEAVKRDRVAQADRVREAVREAVEQCAIEAGERSPEGVSSHTMLGDMWDRRIAAHHAAAPAPTTDAPNPYTPRSGGDGGVIGT